MAGQPNITPRPPTLLLDAVIVWRYGPVSTINEDGGFGLKFKKLCMSLTLGLILLPHTESFAHDGSNTSKYGIVDAGDDFSPSGSSDDSFNGYRVFLSSPRHSDSGNRGECTNPGYQENVNGRQWNWRAANGEYINTTYAPTSHNRNLHSRGYQVRVSRNVKDNGYLDNIQASQNFGANMHIVTHTNASNGCQSSANYMLVMWEDDADTRDDKDLASAIVTSLGPVAPGADTLLRRTDLAELDRNSPQGDAYVELAFHDRQASQTWVHDESQDHQWRYGLSVDNYLDYPS